MFAILSQAAVAFAAPQAGELSRQSSWQPATEDSVAAQLSDWMDRHEFPTLKRDQIGMTWRERLSAAAGLLDALSAVFASVDDRARAVHNVCQSRQPVSIPPSFPWLAERGVDPLLHDNMRLIYGRWLAQNSFYDEALIYLGDLNTRDVVDPAALLFYRSVVHHRLLDKKGCLEDISRLLENEADVPVRFKAVARLMDVDLRPLKEDSLDEIARLMEDIQRRLQLGRAGTRVRKEEEDVVAKLDKMIEKIEEQQQQQQSSDSSGGSSRSNSPAPDSSRLGGRGPGDVDQRDIGDQSGWGNLPPKERQAALQQISKDLPAHFREVIEEYFRKLARDEG
jgi:hypothetical protein